MLPLPCCRIPEGVQQCKAEAGSIKQKWANLRELPTTEASPGGSVGVPSSMLTHAGGDGCMRTAHRWSMGAVAPAGI